MTTTSPDSWPEAGSALAHYGVKGMHWGVRRDKAERAANRARKIAAKAEKRAGKIEAARANRKTIADKYKPVGQDANGRVMIKRRGITGHLPISGRVKTLSKRKTQLLIDQMDLNINYKKASRDRFDRGRVADKVLSEMAAYKYRDLDKIYKD